MSALRVILWVLFLFLIGNRIQDDQRGEAQGLEREQPANRISALTVQPVAKGNTTLEPVTEPADSPAPRDRMFTRANGTHEAWPPRSELSLPAPPNIIVEAEDAAARHWSYRSENFHFVANAALDSEVVREFATLFELAHLYCRQLPFGLDRLHGLQPGGLQVELIEDTAHYVARGGRPNSNGVYLSDSDVILVPFAGIGLKSERGSYVQDESRTNQTLVHEATHMLMRGPLLQEGWFVEGVAEYVATIPISRETLLLQKHEGAITSYLTSTGYRNRGGYNLGTQINLAPLQDFMEADYSAFQSTSYAYPYALLLFTHFAHFDGEGDGQRIRDYVQAIQLGAERNTARELLLAGRSYRTIEKLLTNNWAKHGIELRFTN